MGNRICPVDEPEVLAAKRRAEFARASANVFSHPNYLAQQSSANVYACANAYSQGVSEADVRGMQNAFAPPPEEMTLRSIQRRFDRCCHGR